MKKGGIIFVLLACFFWALDTLIRYPLLFQNVSALKIVFFEHVFLLIFSIVVLNRSWKRLLRATVLDIFYFGMVGILGSAVATLAFTQAFFLINPSVVILLQKLQPLVAISLAALFLKEKLTKRFLFWTGISLIGGFLISYKDIFPKGIFNFDHLLSSPFSKGYALALLAVVGWGAATVFGKKLSMRGFSRNELMVGRFFTAFLFLLPFVMSGQEELSMSVDHLSRIFLMAFISGMVAMALYYQGIKQIPAKLCALAETSFPLWAVILNWIFLPGKELTALQLAGGLLLILGATVIQVKKY